MMGYEGYEEFHGAANSAPRWTWPEFLAEMKKKRKWWFLRYPN